MNGKWFMAGILVLFIGTYFIPALAQDTEKTGSSIRGNWLYVGGNGPGNYTRIMDAMYDVTEGDTVFVYDDSSPYVEEILIWTSISLIGEDKQTTIIRSPTEHPWPVARNSSVGIRIGDTDQVLVKGFTLEGYNLSGIMIHSNKNIITDNIFSDDFYGVATFNEEIVAHNRITDNLFIRDNTGICISNGLNNSITGNVITQTNIGIMVMHSMNNSISNNEISGNDAGVYIVTSYDTLLYRNNISDNDIIGVQTTLTSADKILQNNFIGNAKSASSAQLLLVKLTVFHKESYLPLRRNVWEGNYWDAPRILPYMIHGVLKFWVDWHPAKKPYDFSGGEGGRVGE